MIHQTNKRHFILTACAAILALTMNAPGAAQTPAPKPTPGSAEFTIFLNGKLLGREVKLI